MSSTITSLSMPHVPDFLYKYTSFDYAENVLAKNKIYFAKRRELNDPFDSIVTLDLSTCEKREEVVRKSNIELQELVDKGKISECSLSKWVDKKHQERVIEDEKYAIECLGSRQSFDAANVGLYCLTEIKDSIAMWAYYADNHKGCCLRLKIKKSVEYFPLCFINKVEYSNKRPLWGKNINPNPYSNPFCQFIIKSKEWQHEKEWRVLMQDSRVKSPITGKSILDKTRFPDYIEMIKKMKGAGHYSLSKGLLSGIILGCNMENAKKETIISMANKRRIKVYQVVPKTYEYGMDIVLI